MGVSAVVSVVADAVSSIAVSDVLTGAAIGAITSGVTGGNILQGAALGGIGGAVSDIAGNLYNQATGALSSQVPGTGINLANVGQPGYGAAGIDLAAAGGAPGINLSYGAGGALGGSAATGLGQIGYGGGAPASTGIFDTSATTGIAGAPQVSTPSTAIGGTPTVGGATGTTGATGGGISAGAPAPTQVSALPTDTSLATSGQPNVGINFNPTQQTTGGALGGAGDTTGYATGQAAPAAGGEVAPTTGVSGAGVSTAKPAGDVFKTPSLGVATGEAPVSSAPTGGGVGGVMSDIGTSIKNLPQSILKSVTSNPLPVLATAYQMANQPKLPASLTNVRATAGTEQAAGQQMVEAAQAGKILPAQQAAIDDWVQKSIATVKQYYATQGLSGSSMEASAVNNVMQQAQAQVQSIIQTNYQTGLQYLGAANTGNTAIANANLAQSKQASDALSNLAIAMGQAAGQKSNPTGTSGATGTAV